MSPDDPRHGKYAGEQAHRVDGEDPCGPCTQAAYRYHKKKRMRLDAGIASRVTLGDKAWETIRDNPRRAVHLATGISVAKLCTYRNGGPSTPVLRATRDKIEAFDGRQVITPIGVTRRVRALNRLGYSAQAIANAANCHVESVKDTRRRVPKFVRTDFAARISDAYERLCMSIPEPSRAVSKARGSAERKGWLPPLAWDDIDNEAEQPKGTEIVGHTTEIRATRAAELEHFAHMGDTLETACERLDISVNTLWKWCDRHGYGDLYERLAERSRRGANQWTEGRRTA